MASANVGFFSQAHPLCDQGGGVHSLVLAYGDTKMHGRFDRWGG